jgi:hypothetical protein
MCTCVYIMRNNVCSARQQVQESSACLAFLGLPYKNDISHLLISTTGVERVYNTLVQRPLKDLRRNQYFQANSQ